jgi:3alpha(or 20beta)-hydroxysteroid dehydrogenase
MAKLKDKVAIITGAASGMGASHARKFVEEGAKVAITDLQASKGEKLADNLGENAIFIEHDVTNENGWKKVVETVEERFGPINILVNNAGMTGEQEKLVQYDSQKYLNVINVNLHGYVYGIKAVYESIRKGDGGSIVNIASSAGVRHVKESPNFAYTTSKHGVIGLTKAAAIELADENIRVNAINPGVIFTPMMEAAWDEERIEQAGNNVPIKRLGDAEEVSDLVVYLASDESSYISGEDILVDGALLAE